MIPWLRALSVLLLSLPLGAARAQEAAAAPVTMLRLREGAILFGRIESHDQDGLVFRRIDTGGRVELDFGRLDPDQARQWQIDWGYIDANGGELLVDADRVPLIDGSEAVGLIVNRAPDALHLKTAQSLIRVPLERIGGPATRVQVPALDVYTREELYQQRASELAEPLAAGGAEGAKAAFDLARHCEKILDFQRALTHYEQCASFDPSYKPEDVRGALARTRSKAAAQEQVDALAEIELWRKRGGWDRAQELSAAFPQKYPDSPMLPDWKKVSDRLVKAREAYLKDQVHSLWHREAARAARAAAQKFSFAQAVDYAAGAMGKEVQDSVAKALQRQIKALDAGEVRSLWDKRGNGRVQRVSYGLATWLLGPERARKDLDKKKKAESGPATPSDPERAKLEDALKRYLENQEVARKAQSSAANPDEDPEAQWKLMDIGQRAQWILAYYAENSGDMKILLVSAEKCPECGGTGALEMSFSGSTSNSKPGSALTRLVPCPACKHVGVIRRLTYH